MVENAWVTLSKEIPKVDRFNITFGQFAYRGDKKEAIDTPLPFELYNHCPVQTWIFLVIFTFFHMGIPGSAGIKKENISKDLK